VPTCTAGGWLHLLRSVPTSPPLLPMQCASFEYGNSTCQWSYVYLPNDYGPSGSIVLDEMAVLGASPPLELPVGAPPACLRGNNATCHRSLPYCRPSTHRNPCSGP